MKPLTEEELTRCAEEAWKKSPFMAISHDAFIAAYKQGHAKNLSAWRHGSERPLPATGKKIIVYYKDADGVSCSHTSFLTNLYEWYGVPAFVQDNLMWCYPPEEEVAK